MEKGNFVGTEGGRRRRIWAKGVLIRRWSAPAAGEEERRERTGVDVGCVMSEERRSPEGKLKRSKGEERGRGPGTIAL